MQNVICRSPLRLTFSGAGTDLPYYSTRFGGATLNMAISKHVYIFLHKSFDDKIRLRYSSNEIVSSVSEIQHPLIKTAMQLLEINEPIEIASFSDITSSGSGLGASQAFLISLLHGLHTWKGEHATKNQLVDEAYTIENTILKVASGKQDACAAAFGGFNLWEFQKDGKIKQNPVLFPSEQSYKQFISNSLLLNSGLVRGLADPLLANVAKYNDDEIMHSRKKLAYLHYQDLQKGIYETTGHFIGENQKLTLSSGNIQHETEIGKLCTKIKQAGGSVKSIGAGAGSFLLVFAKPELHEHILKVSGLTRMPFHIDFDGSKIIYAD